ncbi:MAG: hypothetical protein LKKZDAJK_002661 [Candidatus Fervidibacter sp.]
MRTVLVLCWMAMLSFVAVAQGQVGYTYGARILGARLHFVVVNLPAGGVTITPVYVPGGAPFSQMVAAYRPIAAINGTFFHLRTKRPIGDLVISGTHVHQGKLRTAFFVHGPFAFIASIPLGRDLTGKVDALLACGPRLLTDRRVTVSPKAEGFRDGRLFRPARRSVLGITRGGKVVLAVIVTPVTLSHAARILKALGCVDAMNLDGGGSSALYCAGRYFVRPTRPLVTALMVFQAPTLQVTGLNAEGGEGDDGESH